MHTRSTTTRRQGGAYALIVTWFTAVLAFAVIGLWLDARWIVRLLAADDYFRSYEAIGLLATGVALYAIYLALLVVLGRTRRTEYSFPATAAAMVVNIGLNIALVPAHGIVGAGIALVASYAVVLVLMYVLTQRLFRVPYEWRRLALAVGVAAAIVVAGELLLPTEGFWGLAARTALWLSYPLVLYLLRFLSDEERGQLRELLRPGAMRERLRRLRAEPAAVEDEADVEERHRTPQLTPEAVEQAMRDSDREGT